MRNTRIGLLLVIALSVGSEARAPAESEKACAAHNRTRLFHDFSVKGLLPGFLALGTASRPAPSVAVIADQDDTILIRYTETICSMRGTSGDRCRSVPSREPVAAVRINRELFAISGDTTLSRFHHFIQHETVYRNPSSSAFRTARVRSLTPIFERMLEI